MIFIPLNVYDQMPYSKLIPRQIRGIKDIMFAM